VFAEKDSACLYGEDFPALLPGEIGSRAKPTNQSIFCSAQALRRRRHGNRASQAFTLWQARDEKEKSSRSLIYSKKKLKD